MGSDLPETDGVVHETEHAEPVTPVAATSGVADKPAPPSIVKALALGAVAAIVGSLLYAAVDIVVSSVMEMRDQLGYATIALGLLIVKLMGIVVALLIGSVMMWALKRQGSRKLQLAAALLTYLSISMTMVSVQLWDFHLQGQTVTHASLGLIGVLTEYGVISPFLFSDGLISGSIGLLFLFGSMYLAWRMTAGPSKPTAA